MASGNKETMNQIERYYRDLIKPLEDKIKDLKEEKRKEIYMDFEKLKEVKQIKELFNILKSKYPEGWLDLDCKIYTYNVSVDLSENKDYLKIAEKIDKYKNEKSLLIMSLENYPKNSEEYKKALEKCKKLFS